MKSNDYLKFMSWNSRKISKNDSNTGRTQACEDETFFYENSLIASVET